MRVECEFFGPLRDVIGTKTIRQELSADATVADLIGNLADEFGAVDEQVLNESGEVSEGINVTVEGKNVRQLDGTTTALSDGVTVRFAPPVVGG